MTVHSASEHNQHVSRLHHHRNGVRVARAALESATAELVAAHYAQPRPAGPAEPTNPPPMADEAVTPPAAH